MYVRLFLVSLFITSAGMAIAKEGGLSNKDTGELNAKKKNYCAQYEGKLIAFYSDVWRVKDCKRIPLSSSEVYSRTQKGEPVVDVPAEVIRGLKEGEVVTATRTRSCTELNGRYVSLDFEEIWFVESCKKRKFPDWISFSKHRGGLDKEIPILQLSWQDFSNIKDGKDFSSVYDASLEEKVKDVDVVPVAQACRGIEGKFVFFYSRIYRIEKCARRPIDAEVFTKNHPDVSPKELTPEQWISLPIGAPL